MATSLTKSFKRQRREFVKYPAVIKLPNLIQVQVQSYKDFLQADVPPNERELKGLEGVFQSVFPVSNFDDTTSVEFVTYSFEEPKYTVEECRQRGVSYDAALKVLIRLVVHDVDEETGVKAIRDVKEQEVFFGEVPLMTQRGTFIINGTERVVVSQLHRSPGVFFDHDDGKTHASGRVLHSARIIPYRGSWIDFDFDAKGYLYVRIDRRRKLYATILLRALGLSADAILDTYYTKETYSVREGHFWRKINFENLRGQKVSEDVVDPKTGDVLLKKNRKFTAGILRRLEQREITEIESHPSELIGKAIAEDIIDEKTGEVLVDVNTELTQELLQEIDRLGLKSFQIYFIDGVNVSSSIRETVLKDEVATKDEALLYIYKRIRPGDPPTIEAAESLFQKMFFEKDRYDLSTVGRIKLNHKLELDIPEEVRVLTKEDIIKTVGYLHKLASGQGRIDDIDHLGNRRVRSVGELLENQYRVGLLRIERAVRERMSIQEVDTLMPADLINQKPVTAVVKEFFGSSQLSQFMDQNNPLSEITHKRRLSALGPGGLTRERAGFEVRDVHNTHYGRICPIETPEGPNIGLITSMATYAKINKYGFVETPYRTVEDGKVTDKVSYYTALDESDQIIAQATVPVSASDAYEEDLVAARLKGEFSMVRAEEIDLADVASNQLVSAAASLIPFLQNDDANRALMGANMQRQAVPLMRTRSPIVGTGIEFDIARDSGATVVARRDGVVAYVDSDRIVIKCDEAEDEELVGAEVDVYKLIKYQRSNQDTCINQKPIVRIGEQVSAGDVIGDGFATEFGELALGQNMVVAFMPWHGYNFEDSILVSERVVKDECFTSFHIQEFECVARDTKLGKEEITCDIPNLGEDILNSLDEAGIITIGANVSAGQILVGKITPKGETNLTPEEKLLRAIFGEKAGDVRDSSLRVPPGVIGTAISAKVFTREGVEKDERALAIEQKEINGILEEEASKIAIIRTSAINKIRKLALGAVVAKDVDAESGFKASAGDKLSLEQLTTLTFTDSDRLTLKDVDVNAGIKRVLQLLKDKVTLLKAITEDKIRKVQRGDELQPGVIKMVKIYVAIKRRLSVGDKMAGRHGNKGVISMILAEEDMPYLEDGTPVDIVLNPLGVPSRMNIGQVMEMHLGWAAHNLGKQINRMVDENVARAEITDLITKIWKNDKKLCASITTFTDEQFYGFCRKYRDGITCANPVFDGASEAQIHQWLKMAGQSDTGKSVLYDGLTGNKFDNMVTVGIMYILKLHHLVEDKIHARSIGPYSLVTQQPLGGKAQFGGQRLGEMEVWAMEAYGAAYALQGFLTVKSDDVIGRTRMYESIVTGENVMSPGLPESFNVLIKELQSLVLNVKLLRPGKDSLHGKQLSTNY